MTKLSLFATATDSRVDAENGILRGVRVITKGECKGHSFLGEPLIVDDTTIREVVEAAASFKDGVPVKLAHGTDIEELVGSIRNIVADGDCARGDLYLLKSHENYATIIEMAETMPSNFGISISFMNAPEAIKGNDMEPDGDEDDSDEDLRSLVGDAIVAYAARVADLYSADLVANPATGNGLFSAIMPDTTTPEAPAEAAPEVVKVEEVTPEAPAETALEATPEVSPEEVKSEEPAPEAPVAEEAAVEQAPEEAKEEEKPLEPVAPAELSRNLTAITTDFEATRSELSRVQTELASIRTELEAARGEISRREAELTDLRYLHRSVLNVMNLGASIELPEIAEEAVELSVIERYEAMPAGPERLSFFQANRREIERSIESRLKK